MVKILYVEDEPFLAKIVKETLESKNFQVTLVEDGARVVETYTPEKFDICVLDIMLPNKNGFEIAREIRTQYPQVPIIFLTAKDQIGDVLKGFDVGGNDYIKKPFSMDELIVRIENLLKITSRKVSNATGIPIGRHFHFYPQKLELHYQLQKRALSYRESQILELLCEHQGATTSRKDILLKIWGDDSIYNSRNLDVYITKLRSYFKRDPQVKITTLKGVGYQFIVEN